LFARLLFAVVRLLKLVPPFVETANPFAVAA
jgi:hypothetical protein